MGYRFRKSITLLPGVRVNVSKSGASLSLGPKGATVNLGKGGVRGTYDLPGSGSYYTKQKSWSELGRDVDKITGRKSDESDTQPAKTQGSAAPAKPRGAGKSVASRAGHAPG